MYASFENQADLCGFSRMRTKNTELKAKHLYTGAAYPGYKTKRDRHLRLHRISPQAYHAMFMAACWARELWAAFILPKFHLTPKRT